MASKFAVSAEFRADDKASASIEKIEGRFARLSRFLAQSFVITLGDLTRGVRSVVHAFGSFVDAAKVQEDAVNALKSALSSLGPAADGVSTALQRQAAALQQSSRFGDEAIIQGQALLASYVKNEEALKSATAAAVDFAAATGRDLRTVFELLAKASVGATGELSRYGIILEEGIPQGEKFAAVIQKINEQFGGRAQQDVATFAGTMAQLSNAFGDLQEQVGVAVTENREIRIAFQELTKVLADDGTTDALAAFAGAVATASNALVTTIVKVNEFSESVGLLLANLTGNLESVEISTSAYEATAKRLGITVGELKTLIAENVAAQKRLNAEHRDGAEAASAAAAGTEQYADSLDRVARIQQENSDASANFVESLAKLGVVTEEQVNAGLRENAELMEQAEEQYRRGAITRADFERIERGVAEANSRANEKLREQLGLLEEYEPATRSAARATDDWTRELDRSTDALVRNANAAVEARNAAGGFAENLLGGQSSFATISGGTFSKPTNPLGPATKNLPSWVKPNGL